MKRAAILFGVFIVIIVILADTGNMPHFLEALYDFPNGDRVGHFILFGILNFLVTSVTLSAFLTRAPLRVALSTGLILALFIAAEEYSQRYFSTRTPDWVDLSASYLGLVVGGFAAFRFRTKR